MTSPKISVGNCEVVSIHDMDLDFPAPMMFPDIPISEFEAYRDLYPECFGNIGLAANCGAYAVRSRDKTIVVDTGMGPGPIQMLGGITGALIPDLKAKGIAPESVDIVVHTHLHIDHVGWNIGPDGKPNFPNATYYAPVTDLEFFGRNPAANPHMEQVLPLKEMGRLESYDGETALTDEVTTIPTPGHTPGHHSVLVNSGGERLLIMGDLAHHPAQVDRCDWCPSFDTDHAAASATREKVFKELEAEGYIAAFCHFPGTGFGRIARKDNRRVFLAL